jgi:aspartate racemase
MSAATKSIGVIGGMGPAATLDFFERILKRTKALRDEDHLRVIIDNNTKIPSRDAASKGEGPSPGAMLAATARGLQNAGADFIVMACNTAHASEAEIRAAISVPFLSMIDETVAAVAELRPERVGLLAADPCLRANLYQEAFRKAGLNLVLLPPDSQRTLQELINRIKSGDTGDAVRRSMATLAKKLEAQGAEVIVAGCTEVPIVLSADDLDCELVNSTDVLVEKAIVFAGGTLLPST